MPKTWVRERKRDYYYRKAKEEEYRSRAAYKLLQAVKKYHFIGEGDVVIDLGAAPGGWLQVSQKIVGKKGLILGVDSKTTKPLKASNVRVIVGDITNPKTERQIALNLPFLANTLISDVSPNISGVWEVDHARQIDLAQQSLSLALKFLNKNGNFFVKVFQGDMFQSFVDRVKQHFSRVEIIKPKASRAKSAEIFILGMGFQGLPDLSSC
ncbi:MAG: RlmE family RNA methyltransferase [Candidatus Bathyarchaeota archaeon]|nr:MAG: RlmE family RNA methyltransferase [Candidatus Bathyarchaeota archaeon]